MKYNELVEEAKKAIPEFDAAYNESKKRDIIDEDAGVHIVFSYVFVPLAVKAVNSGGKDLIEKTFSFIEKMAESNDRLVSEVCDFTVMEGLADELPTEQLWQLLGPKAKESLAAVAQYMDI